MICKQVLASLLLFGGTSLASAQEPAPKDKTAATHDEIRAVRDGLLKAIKAKDVEGLLKYLHPDVVLTSQDGKEQKAIRKHDGVREYVARQLTGPNAHIMSIEPAAIVDELTILHGDNAGIAFGSSRDQYILANGSEWVLPTRWSATLVKHEGQWKIANLHYSTNLFENPVLDAVTKMLYWVAGGALALGFLLGLLVMKLVGGKSKPASAPNP